MDEDATEEDATEEEWEKFQRCTQMLANGLFLLFCTVVMAVVYCFTGWSWFQAGVLLFMAAVAITTSITGYRLLKEEK